MRIVIQTFRYLFLLAILSSCAQFNVLHTARTEGKGNLSLTPGISGISSPDQNPSGGDIGSVVLPYAQLETAYGITEHLDVVASLSTSANLLGSIKYQIIGDRYSPFGLSIMPGFEYQFRIFQDQLRVSRLHLPLILSYYTSEDFGLFAIPKYVIQVEEGTDNFSFPGITAGIAIDRRVKYRIGAGVYIPFTQLVGVQGTIYHFGVSAIYPLR